MAAPVASSPEPGTVAAEIPADEQGGTGVFLYPNGAKYEGQWIWSVPEGSRSATPAVVEEAAPAKGKPPPKGKDAAPVVDAPPPPEPKVRMRHGQGIMIEGDNVYEGEWEHDMMQGNGLFKFAGGASYDGECRNNTFHGKGKYTWASGAYYIGEFENNKMHGDGAYYDEESRKWIGKFYNGVGPGLHTL